MLPDELPDAHTATILAARLAKAGAPPGMVARAGRGYYHDYLSDLAMPAFQLVQDLRAAARKAADPEAAVRLMAVADEVMEGRHDASKAEADEWARSEDGQATISLLTGRPPER